MANPKKVQLGDDFTEFPGESFNALVGKFYSDAAEESNNPTIPGVGNKPYILAQVQNTTSEAIGPGEVLGRSEPIVNFTNDPFQVFNPPIIKGATPQSPEHDNKFVVFIDGVPADGVGPAIIMGLAYVQVVWSDETHTKVKIVEGETLLQSSDNGIEPEWIEEIPDPEYLPATLWALVMLGSSGSATLEALYYVVTTEIPAATGDTDEIVAAKGQGQAYTTAWDSDDEVFKRTKTGDPVDIWNFDTCDSYSERTAIWCSTMDVGGRTLIEVLAPACCQLAEGE